MTWSALGPRSRSLIVALALTAACGDDAPVEQREDSQETGAKKDAGTNKDAGKSNGSDSGIKSNEPPSGRDAGVLDASASTKSSGLPCDVEKVLVEHCAECHGAKPPSPAQPTVIDFAGITAASPSDPSTPVYERVLARLDDQQRPMPPLGAAPDGIPAADKKLIEDWINAGHTRSDAACDAPVAPSTDAGTGTGFDYSQCDYQLEFLAHNGTAADDKVGYQPPQQIDHYECFNFTVPWDEKVQGIRFDPIIDDQRVVHHWILYSITEQRAAGSHGCGGANRTFVNGWAPGGPPSEFSGDVGLQLPQKGSTFQLEVHYNNPTMLTDVKDRSGVKLCATKNLRKNEAATFWLGSVFISLPPGQTTKVTDTCTVPSPGKGPVQILSTSPHMHQLGVHMTTTIKHKNGSVETLTDRPFDFKDQAHYDSSLVVQPGDQLTTTCTYKNTSTKTVSFGEGTGDEMCFNFVTAYPVNGLGDGNRCMGLNPFAGALDGLFGSSN